MQIQEVKEEQIWIIQLLSNQVWPHTFKDILSEEQIAYMMDMMYSTSSLQEQMTELDHHYLIAEENGEYLGYVSYELNYQKRPCTKIHKIYILPSTQGKGVGRFLISAIADVAIKHENSELRLNVNRENKAIGFYKNQGFEIVGEEDLEIGNGFLMEDYIMSKKL